MRPAGEVRRALLQACLQLATPGQGVTLREMAHQAQVGVDAAAVTIKNMRRAGQICIAGERCVDYRNRPVTVYLPAQLAPPPAGQGGCMGLAHGLRLWAAC